MSDRVEINEKDLEDVVGGRLRWKGNGTVFAVNDPDIVFHYVDYPSCLAYIKSNWTGGEQTVETLYMLRDAGLVW